jgi:predicted nuclease of predicted toxin-antitoxin system
VKVLLDHCVPKRFGKVLPGHDVWTAASQGWSGLSNGELLRAAAAVFGAMVTMDRSIRNQQSAAKLPIPVIALVAVNNRFDTLEPLAAEVLRLLSERLDRRVYLVEASTPRRGRDR